MSYERTNNATNQYLGHCCGCNEFEALSNIEGLCYKCRTKTKEEFDKEKAAEKELYEEGQALKKAFEDAKNKGKLFNVNTWKLKKEKEKLKQTGISVKLDDKIKAYLRTKRKERKNA
jgi:hypothetical protein